MAEFNELNNHSLIDATAHEILGKILSGELKVNSWLPPERDLAEQLGISRSTLHQAIMQLETQGFLRIVPRKGTQIRDYRKKPTSQSILAVMTYGNLGDAEESLYRDLMDTRLWLETECARRACTHIYQSTFDEMQAIVNELTIPDVDRTELIYRFHLLLTRASGNSIYTMIFTGFEPVLKEFINIHYGSDDVDIETFAALHAELLGYIRDKEPEKAASCVSDIITRGIRILDDFRR